MVKCLIPIYKASCLSTLISVLFLLPASCQDAKELNLQGIKLQSDGKLTDAADCYRRAIKQNPGGAAYHNNLAMVLKDMGQLPGAEQEEKQALKLKPNRSDYHFNLAIILQKENKLAESEVEFQGASSQEPMDSECHYRLAEVLSQSGKLGEAEQEIKLALMIKPDQFLYHKFFGDILAKDGHRDDEALNEYRTAAVNMPPDSTASADLQNKIDYLKRVLKSR